MNLADITTLSNGPLLELIQWLQGHDCLANPLRCVLCNHAMDLTERNRDHVDGYLWFVYSTDPQLRKCSMCHRKKSLRTGSFFREFPRLPLGKLLLCIYFWSVRELRTTVAQMLNLTKNTVGNVYALLRHYCGRDIQDRPIVPFGGASLCGEITIEEEEREMMFGLLVSSLQSTAPVAATSKSFQDETEQCLHKYYEGYYYRGQRSTPTIGVHIGTSHVMSLITVVHRDNFVDPVTGIHTQEVESAWSRLKYHIKREKGIWVLDLQDFLNEEMWRQWKGLDSVFQNVVTVITRYHQF
ncbi:hypothetical protein P5673_018917 [Acropora cervicornis]|uniref:Transposase n=1 Tax=Acropora cervicornis TaxID=6130 RepID=A0AAD9QCE0_ACRCE|nr:hypothetical protein P5673_018917 [Acropora cervicornis]